MTPLVGRGTGVLVLAGTLALVSCGGDAGGVDGGTVGTADAGETLDEPTNDVTGDDEAPGGTNAGEALRQRCRDLDRTLRGGLVYDTVVPLVVGDPTPYEVRITAGAPSVAGPADTSDGGLVTVEVLTACEVTAWIQGSQLEVAVDPPEPVTQNFRSGDTVTWRWYLTAVRPGEHELTLRVQPLLLLVDADGASERRAEATPEPLPIVVEATETRRQWLRRWLDDGGEMARSAGAVWGLASAVVVGLSGLVLWFWRRRRRPQRRRRGRWTRSDDE